MTNPTPAKKSYHWFIIETNNDFDIGGMLDKVFKDATGAAIYSIVPMNDAALTAPPPVVPPPPAYPPLWTGTALMDLVIRDDKGVNVGVLKNGVAVSVYAEGGKFGGYVNRVTISHPIEKNQNVWAEGIKKS